MPFKGPLSSRSTTKPKSVPYIEQEHNEDDYGNHDSRRLEEEFEAEYDYPSQEEEEQTYGRIERQPAETTDSGNEISSNSDSEEENNHRSMTIPHHEESSHRGKKRRISTAISQQEEASQGGKKRRNEEREEEEGEVSDNGDGNQSQVNRTRRTSIHTYFIIFLNRVSA